MKLTIGYITCRSSPRFEWFLESLMLQMDSDLDVVVIDSKHPNTYSKLNGGKEGPWVPKVIDPADDAPRHQTFLVKEKYKLEIEFHLPKPSVWQGKHRLTKEDWWAIANAKNTVICLARNPFVAFCDDRSVLVPTWLAAVKEAMEKNYVVAGAYEKVHHLQVENGLVTGFSQPGDGKDFRYPKSGRLYPQMIGGNSFYGCTGALPLEWALEVNGFPQEADSLGLEDCLFGSILDNCGKPFFYDPRMLLVEDRTPSELEPPPLRTDKGTSPNDRSHMLKHKIEVLKRCNPEFDLRSIRETVLAGGEFPLPSGPTHDYWDNTPLGEMTVQ